LRFNFATAKLAYPLVSIFCLNSLYLKIWFTSSR